MGVMLGGGFVLSNRSFAYRRRFRTSLLAVVSSYPFVGSPLVLVLEVIIAESEKALEFLFLAQFSGKHGIRLVRELLAKKRKALK